MPAIGGMIVPLITPFTSRMEVDTHILEQLCERQIEAGVNVIFALGTTGEFYGLTSEQRRQVVDTIISAVRDRIPVIVGISGDSTAAALANFRLCRHEKAAGYVASTPYFLSYTQDELKDHFSRLCDAIGEPLILYNYPHRYRHRIDIDTVAWLAERRMVRSIKDTAGDFSYLQQLVEVRRSYPQLGVFESALQNLPRAAPLGIQGSVQAIANLFPNECASLWTSIQSHSRENLAHDVERLWTFHVNIEKVAIFIASLKGCMAARDWCSPLPAAPTRPVSPEQMTSLRSSLSAFFANSKG